jgi:alpha-amylase
MKLYEGYQLNATVYPASLTNPYVTWTSSSPGVISVSSAGYLSAVGTGTSTITATSGGRSASCYVTVTSEVTSVTIINNLPAQFRVGDSHQLAVSVLPANASSLVTWYSGNPTVAVVSNGYVTGVGVGTAVIFAISANGKVGMITIQVAAVPVGPTE